MTEKPLNPSRVQSVFKNVHEGMDVYDSRSQKIGTVEELYFGASSDELTKYGAGAASAPDPDLRANALIDDVAQALFGEEDVPEEMRQRLINDGFVRIDASGLLAGDRYALPEQIDHVSNERVYLNVTLDELLRK